VPRRIRPGRLRRRLAISFVLVAGISAGALALGSFLLVRQSRLDESLDRNAGTALSRLRLAAQQFLPLDESRIDGLLAGVRDEGLGGVVIHDGVAASLDESFPSLIAASLTSEVRSGRLGFDRVVSANHHILVIGGRIPGSTDELYLLFNEDRIYRDLSQLRNVLLIGFGVVLLLAGLVGSLLARRALGPVAKASQAARSMAEGLLATRLPVEGQDEFGAWGASFNEMAEALEAKINALSEAQARERRFTSDVAHELRTPLTALVGEASLLREHLAQMPEESRRPAELLIQDVTRLRKLVDELMEISRLDAGRETVQAERVDVRPLVEAVIRARGWDDRVRMEGDGATLTTDRRRLERIIANLVGNAVEHAGAGVRVRVETGERNTYVEVIDAGPGIPSDHLPHLFERFYKADPARSRGGSGLGLAIAIENARLLGGDIEVRSELGVGTAFRLVLPVTEPLQAGEGGVSPGADHES
jgi:signal transduction histidine kinase